MKISDVIQVIKLMGLDWTIFRLSYEIKKKLGFLKLKFPVGEFTDDDFINEINNNNLKTKTTIVKYIKMNRERFLFNSVDLDSFGDYIKQNIDKKEINEIINIANNAIEGRILCFNHWVEDYGNPINWHRNPITNYEWANDIHWSAIEELSKQSGDVKYVWEASRFTQVYYFTRAYTITKDEKYVEAYWDQVEQWIERNPYELGVNWKCGQEIAFRTFAWIFGLYTFIDSPITTDKRLFLLIKNIYLNAKHIEKNIDFALKAVKNNHAISEAAGLYTVGLLFPIFKDSDRWLGKGKRFLEEEGLKQIYEDGSYLQHSMNYHRLMLQDYAWCLRLADINKDKFSQELKERLKLAVGFLYQVQDGSTGMVPNYGSNDGALVFPLSVCDYLNYKPQLNTLHYILNEKKLYKNDIHNEELMWFCGLNAAWSDSYDLLKRDTKRYDIGGYYIIRNNNGFGMIRCAKFKDRPGQADMLHFDLWHKGINILTDIGSYSYNPEEKYKGYFSATKNHNTVMINDTNQVRKGPRFLTLDWTEGFLNEFKSDEDTMVFSGYHTAYENIHTRNVEHKNNCYIITDKIDNKEGKKINIRLNWNIGTQIEKIKGNKYRLIIDDRESFIMEISSSTKGNIRTYFGNEETPAGWRSLYYGEKVAMNQMVYEIESNLKEEVIVTAIYSDISKSISNRVYKNI